MNRTPLLLLGIFLTVAASWVGLVAVPNWQLASLQPLTFVDAAGATQAYPIALSSLDAEPGRHVYMGLGCIYCHSQQVRDEGFGADVERGWGQRRSVPRDYLLQSPPLLGTMRTGPDLANIGTRQPSDSWHHLHLYDPRLVSPGSIMPPFPFLYELVTSDPGSHGYRLPDHGLQHPAWIIPSQQADHLVAYIKALHQDRALAEVAE